MIFIQITNSQDCSFRNEEQNNSESFSKRDQLKIIITSEFEYLFICLFIYYPFTLNTYYNETNQGIQLNARKSQVAMEAYIDHISHIHCHGSLTQPMQE